MPPLGFAVAVPVLLPLHVREVELALTANAGGSEIFHETDEVQPVWSVTVVVYDPAHNPVIVFVVLLLLQTMVLCGGQRC